MKCESLNNYARTYYVVRIFVKGSLEYRESRPLDKASAVFTAKIYVNKGHEVQILKVTESTEV